MDVARCALHSCRAAAIADHSLEDLTHMYCESCRRAAFREHEAQGTLKRAGTSMPSRIIYRIVYRRWEGGRRWAAGRP
ncbi:unnamed protein product, partial [Amoebophrya sp. A25]|eukprot:GSA25T00021405001.1